MKKTLLKTLALVLVLALTASLFIGCGKQPDPTTDPTNAPDPTTPTTGFDAAAAMAGFATAVEGTVKLTYVTNYKVDVVRPGEAGSSGMDSFKRDVVATANEGYEIVKVIVNGNETPITDPAMAGGFYCFNVAPGNNTIEVMFKESEPTMGVVTVDNSVNIPAGGVTFYCFAVKEAGEFVVEINPAA